MGQSVYAVGSVAELGNWAPAAAIKLSPTSYPTWQVTISVPSSQAIEWKCLKRSESDPSVSIEWQGGANNAFDSGQVTSSVGAF